MVSVTQKEIDEAADAYALNDLGTVQYMTNPDAVQAITETFKAGCFWIMVHASTKNSKENN